ncbi:MAG: glutamate-5-semialdehyde dehydrogenase, partial [Firmicutes bacterium]|nr:glutamate-5-semialdehyde dehydrogenase [Bacillota bacterium]
NAVVLRGSKDAYASNKAIVDVIKAAVKKTTPSRSACHPSIEGNFCADFIQLIEDTTREGAGEFMRARGLIDVLIPRGSAALIENAVLNSTVPVIETGAGNCHIYVDKCTDVDMAANIIINAKCQRPSVCNAAETLLINEVIAGSFLPLIVGKLNEAGVVVYGDKIAQKACKGVLGATEDDYYKEYGALEIAVKVVKDVDEVINHINKYGTKHSDAIVTKDEAVAKRFVSGVDSACVYVNASTRFSDGFEFGLGAEVGISTQKLHARGPMGLEALTSAKFVIVGEGQTRG